jgi:hypothetical protein
MTVMRWFMGAITVLAILLVFTAPGFSDEECFRIVDSGWGRHCDDSSSLEITLKNYCDQPLVLSFCLEQNDGNWQCDIKENIEPNATSTFWACNCTGKYKLKACTGLEDCNAMDQ